MRQRFLVVDPFHEYASRLIDLVSRRYGYEPLAVLTTEPPRDWSAGRSMACERVAPADVRGLGERLRSEAVVGVIPHAQTVIRSAADLLLGLGSSWNSPDLLRVLDDKFALKDRIRDRNPGLRVGMSCLIGADGLTGAQLPERFVLKPRYGYGNRNVGFFAANSPRAEIDRFMRGSGETAWLLEEFLEGPEFFVDGQIDSAGQATVVAVFEYQRIKANGHQVDWLTTKVSRASEEFSALERFAQAVLSALDLRRSPFHLEAKLRDGVPALVEVNPRLAGNRHALLCGTLHGVEDDLFAVAAEHYLKQDATSTPRLDWERYEREQVLYVHGVSDRRGVVCEVAGISAIENHPWFAGWGRRPALGDPIRRTVDLFTSPWCFVLRAPEPLAALRSEADRLRLQLDLCPRPLTGRSSIVHLRYLLGRALLPRLLRGMRLARLGDLARRVGSGVSRIARSAQRIAQDVTARTGPRRVPGEPSSVDLLEMDRVHSWVREYLGEPHIDLGRPGPVCPFAVPSLNRGRLRMVVERPDKVSRGRLRAVLLAHAAAFEQGIRRGAADGSDGLDALVVIFPSLPPERFVLLDDLHDELKTTLMRRGLMVSPFHPRSERPGIWNHAFRPLRSPFPGFAFRSMDVRDIKFLSHNRRAFDEYRRRFGARYAAGEVSDRHGYSSDYGAAMERFAGSPRERPS